MEYMDSACHLQTEDETRWIKIKIIMTKSFLSEIIKT